MRKNKSNQVELVEEMQSRRVVGYDEFVSSVLKKMNVKSKKRRIRKKVFTKAMAEQELSEKSFENNDSTLMSIEKIESSFDIDSLPVTFLLKLGKKYIGDEEVVKYYYNQEKTTYYKNKEELVRVLNERTKTLSPELYDSYKDDVENELTKRAKK